MGTDYQSGFVYVKLVQDYMRCNQFLFVYASMTNVYFVLLWLYIFVCMFICKTHLCVKNYAIRSATLNRKTNHLKLFCSWFLNNSPHTKNKPETTIKCVSMPA